MPGFSRPFAGRLRRLRALVDNSLWYRQTTAFAGKRFWRAPVGGVRAYPPSPGLLSFRPWP